jgi:hypothetical protein
MTPGEARPQNAGLDCHFFTDLKFLQDASGKAVAHLPKAPENGGHLLQGAGTEHHQQQRRHGHGGCVSVDDVVHRDGVSHVPAALRCMFHVFDGVTSIF